MTRSGVRNRVGRQGGRCRRGIARLSGLIPYGVAAVLLLALARSPIAETLNLLYYDLVTSLRPAPSAIGTPILIVGLDEADIRRYGWPIDDRLLCEAIDRLRAGGALAIGLDLYRDKGVGADHECLRQRFRSDPRLVSIVNRAESIGPLPGTPPDRQGFNDLVVDPDGVVRRDLVHVAGQDEGTVSFPLRMLEVGLGARWLRLQLEGGRAEGPWLDRQSSGYDRLDAAGYQQMMVFRELGSFPLWPLRDLLRGQRIPPGQIRDHLVLIGSTAPSLKDLFPVPQTRFRMAQRQLQVSGVELHAHRLASLLDRREGNDRLRIRTTPAWVERGLELLAIALGIGVGEGILSLRRSVLLAGALLVAQISVGGLLLFHHLWIGTSMPVASLGLMAAAAWVRRGSTSQLQRQQIERLLGQTTSPAVARQLWSERENLLREGRFEGRQLPVTVLMADIAGFTSIAEKLPPAALLGWLNRGMACLIPAITHQGGMVNKFTGDGLLAVFGAPVSQGVEADALAALQAALAIQEGIAALNETLKEEGAPAMRMRLGLHSGQVLAGSVGSSERLEYAVIGDAVNCAARLESLEKQRQDNPCRVLLSSGTRALLPENLPVRWKIWGGMQVKGREAPLEIWEVRGRAQ